MLQSIKSLLLFILLLTVVTAGTYVAFNRGLIKSNYLAQVTEKLNQLNPNIDKKSLENITLSAQEQSQVLIDRGGVVLGESKEFINTQIKPAENKEPIYSKTLEYARYMYCKQVVKDFEN